ncbi:MAG: Protein containing Heat shock protein Hsp20 protein [Parcubacteria bacterium C7867-005]|nr:MAG: Protein containing Heat shock protein Hsp20 protein [Parcubacteria bacterium C7867-005]
MHNKRSFFERLTGAVRLEDEQITEEPTPSSQTSSRLGAFEEEEEGQLTVDVYQTPSEIVIKTMVAGVKPEDLDVTITRDSVTIRGKREEDRTLVGDDYIHRELYWGSFSRVIPLPEEIDVEESEAVEKYGLLILRLPKIDKHRLTKLKVKGQ